MKLEKIWIVICLILVTGVLSTSYVKRLVTASVPETCETALAEKQEVARLQEVDRQMERSRSQQAEKPAGAKALGAGAEAETWQNQLEGQLDRLEQALGEQETEELFAQQSQWTKACETRDEENASKVASGELTREEYQRLQAQAIRERCYELAAEYPDILAEAGK